MTTDPDEAGGAGRFWGGGHLSAKVVVDVARGVTDITAAGKVQDHLAGCAACAGKVNAWKGFAALAARDCRVSVPDPVLARVLALAEQRPAVSTLTRVKAALGYDSALVPVPAGVRGQYLPEQVAYEADGVAVDLRVSEESARNMVIVGQLTEVGRPQRHLSDLPVLLLEGDDVKVRATSNAYGEFHLEHPRHDQLRLEVGLPGGRIVRIPLRRGRSES
jgi:hypothetical protein